VETLPLPPEKPPVTEDEEIFETIRGWVGSKPHTRKIDIYRDLARKISDPLLQAQALDLLATFEIEAVQPPDEGSDELEHLKAALEGARTEIDRLKTPPEPPPREPPEAADTGPPEEAPPPTEAETKDAETEAAYRDLSEQVRGLLGMRKYGPAMKLLDAFSEKHAGTEWGQKAANERRRVRSDAYQTFDKLRGRADVLVKNRDFDGARQLYREALEFEMPQIVQMAEQALAAIPGGGAESTAETQPAVVKQFLEGLKSADRYERARAARRLGDLGIRSAEPHLIQALKDTESWYVRSAAARALGKIGSRTAVPSLVAALDDEEAGVAHDALLALQEISGQDFAKDEQAKWLSWYRERGRAGPKEAVELEPGAFVATILDRQYQPDRVGFVVPEGVVAVPGATATLRRGGTRIAELTVREVTDDRKVSGELANVRTGETLVPGDQVVIRFAE